MADGNILCGQAKVQIIAVVVQTSRQIIMLVDVVVLLLRLPLASVTIANQVAWLFVKIARLNQ